MENPRTSGRQCPGFRLAFILALGMFTGCASVASGGPDDGIGDARRESDFLRREAETLRSVQERDLAETARFIDLAGQHGDGRSLSMDLKLEVVRTRQESRWRDNSPSIKQGGPLQGLDALLTLTREHHEDLKALGDSYPSIPFLHASVHDRITEAGLDGTGLEGITTRIQFMVRKIDWDETSLGLEGLVPNGNYRAAHHFDRGRDVSHGAAFAAGLARVRRMEDEFAFAFINNVEEDAYRTLGALLHALQDFFSHSNFIDLPLESQQEVLEVLDGATSVPPPAGLRLTAFFPDANPPGNPPGDSYSHDRFSKDNEKKNEESSSPSVHDPGITKFQAHFSAAVAETHRSVMSLHRRLAMADPGWDDGRKWMRFGRGRGLR